MELLVHEDKAEVAAAVSRRVGGIIDAATDMVTLGLAGGSTPRDAYERMATEIDDWHKVDAWLSDERWVPMDHERCNGAMAAMALMDRVPATFHRPPWDPDLTPEASAAAYDATLHSIHAHKSPDVVLLGIGDDGHTASLFPGTEALEVRDRWFVANHVPQQGEDRLTATYPLLWSAKLLIVMAVGQSKAEALRAALQGQNPAGRIGEGDAAVEWYADREAASLA